MVKLRKTVFRPCSPFLFKDPPLCLAVVLFYFFFAVCCWGADYVIFFWSFFFISVLSSFLCARGLVPLPLFF